MLTVPSTTRESEPPGTGALDDPLGCRGSRSRRRPRATGGRCARRAPRRSPSAASAGGPPPPRRGPGERSLRTGTDGGRTIDPRGGRGGTGIEARADTPSHRGAGRQKRRPMSMIAWFQSPGAVGSSHACASLARSAGRDLVRLGATHRPRDDPPDVAVQRRDGGAVADRRHRRGRVRTDPGEPDQRGHVVRHAPSVLTDDGSSGLVESDGAPVVAESGPRPEHVGARGRGERVDAREPRDERLEDGFDARGLRLLEHDLGDPGFDTGSAALGATRTPGAEARTTPGPPHGVA